MASTTVTPENFGSEVLRSDKPVLVISLPINYGDESDPNDDSIEIFNMRLAEFKSEVEKTVGDKYKVALVDYRQERELGLMMIVPRIYPPPIPFVVIEKGEQGKRGFLMAFSKDQIFESLKQQLSS